MSSEKELREELEQQGVNPAFVNQAFYYFKSIGVDPDKQDIVADYGSDLSVRENMQKLKQKYPGANHEQMARNSTKGERNWQSNQQDLENLELRRKGGYNPSNSKIPSQKTTTNYQKRSISRSESDATLEEQPKTSQPSLLDRLTGTVRGMEEKYIEEPRRRRLKEGYFKAQEKIKEHELRLRTKYAERQERELRGKERELDREAFRASPTGQILAGVQGFGGGIRSMGSAMGGGAGYRPSFTDTNALRSMMAPNSNMFAGNSKGGSSVVLGLLTGKQADQRKRGHYVTVIQHGQARRVYVGEQGANPAQYGQPTQQQQSAPNPLIGALTPNSMGFNLSGNNQLRNNLALGRAKYGYSLKPSKKMKYI